MAKQAIKKGNMIKKSGLAAFKEKVGLNASQGVINTTISNANKTQSWILMPKAFQEATKLPGIPECTVVSVIGHSNVGKTTLLNHAIASAHDMDSRTVSFLLSKGLLSDKAKHAKKWGVPVLKHQWLFDCIVERRFLSINNYIFQPSN